MLTQSTWQHYNAATGEGTGTPALTRWVYDPATGQLAQKQHADGKGPSYGYTPGGRLASRTWARGTSTTYVYDDAGMMRSLDHSDSTPDVAFSYTRTGQLDTVQDGALSGSGIATPRFTHSYTYSSIGQLTTESSTTTVGRTLTRVYEIDGTVPGRSIGWDLHTPDDPADEPSHWQRYGFDGAGRLNAVSSPAGEYSYTYVEQSHLLASVTGPVHTVTNSYESGRDTMTAKVNATSSSTISRFGARYDALGRRVEITRSGSAFAQNFVSDYQYDLLGQLTKDERFAGEVPGDPAAKLEGESFSFLYDGIGNRLTAQKGTDTTAYTPNALNQYTDIDGIEPVYDADGNLFSDGKNRFHWDAENRLTLVEPLVPTEGSKRLEFKYDYIGRRVSKQVWTHTGGSWTDTSTTAFVYDGWNLIEEISTSSQTASINHYTWGLDLSGSLHGAGGVGGLLSVVCAPFTESGLIGDWLLPIDYVPPALSGVEGPAPSTFHYTFDLNGNVSEVLDSTGTIAAHYEYGPFGELTHESHSSNSHLSLLTFNFSTKYYDAELKTLYYGYRYYDPETGRWLNRDPIEESGGFNLYGFVGNDGVNWWDVIGNKRDSNGISKGDDLNAPDAEEGWGLPGGGRFAGPGYAGRWDSRPHNLFGFASKLHDGAYQYNKLTFKFYQALRITPNDKEELSRMAKADFIFRKMTATGGHSYGGNILRTLAAYAFFGHEKYFLCDDKFVNVIDLPDWDNDKHLMIPFSELPNDEKRKLTTVETQFVTSRRGSSGRMHTTSVEVEIRDYSTRTDYDKNTPWRTWAANHYGVVWDKIRQITDKTDSSFVW